MTYRTSFCRQGCSRCGCCMCDHREARRWDLDGKGRVHIQAAVMIMYDHQLMVERYYVTDWPTSLDLVPFLTPSCGCRLQLRAAQTLGKVRPSGPETIRCVAFLHLSQALSPSSSCSSPLLHPLTWVQFKRPFLHPHLLQSSVCNELWESKTMYSLATH